MDHNSHPPDNPMLLKQQFVSFGHFADVIREWNLEFHQLDRGGFWCELVQLKTNSLLISKSRFNRQLDQSGGAPPNKWTFCILEPDSPNAFWHGQNTTNQMLMVYPPGSEIEAVSPPGWHILTLSIPMDTVECWFNVIQTDGVQKVRLSGGMKQIHPDMLSGIRRAPNRVLIAAEVDDSLVPAFQKDVTNITLQSLLTVSAKRSKWSTEKRSRIMKSLKDYIEANLDEHITLMDMCSFSGVGPRTIQRIFVKHYGVTPKAYITARRLNRVRRVLLSKKTRDVLVSEVANRWGFWHMGQFAADYRKFFGELPSETLKKKTAWPCHIMPESSRASTVANRLWLASFRHHIALRSLFHNYQGFGF